MNLTALQEDALTEVINIGFGRAAASLSKLTGQRFSGWDIVTRNALSKSQETRRSYCSNRNTKAN